MQELSLCHCFKSQLAKTNWEGGERKLECLGKATPSPPRVFCALALHLSLLFWSLLLQVPSLNSTPPWSLPQGSLVRFRCMIQDMFDPEYYLAVYETVDPADKTAVSVVAIGNHLD